MAKCCKVITPVCDKYTPSLSGLVFGAGKQVQCPGVKQQSGQTFNCDKLVWVNEIKKDGPNKGKLFISCDKGTKDEPKEGCGYWGKLATWDQEMQLTGVEENDYYQGLRKRATARVPDGPILFPGHETVNLQDTMRVPDNQADIDALDKRLHEWIQAVEKLEINMESFKWGETTYTNNLLQGLDLLREETNTLFKNINDTIADHVTKEEFDALSKEVAGCINYLKEYKATTAPPPKKQRTSKKYVPVDSDAESE